MMFPDMTGDMTDDIQRAGNGRWQGRHKHPNSGWVRVGVLGVVALCALVGAATLPLMAGAGETPPDELAEPAPDTHVIPPVPADLPPPVPVLPKPPTFARPAPQVRPVIMLGPAESVSKPTTVHTQPSTRPKAPDSPQEQPATPVQPSQPTDPPDLPPPAVHETPPPPGGDGCQPWARHRQVDPNDDTDEIDIPPVEPGEGEDPWPNTEPPPADDFVTTDPTVAPAVPAIEPTPTK